MISAGQWLHVVGEYQTLTTPSPCSSAHPGTINIRVDAIEQNFADDDRHRALRKLRQRVHGPMSRVRRSAISDD